MDICVSTALWLAITNWIPIMFTLLFPPQMNALRGQCYLRDSGLLHPNCPSASALQRFFSPPLGHRV